MNIDQMLNTVTELAKLLASWYTITEWTSIVAWYHRDDDTMVKWLETMPEIVALLFDTAIKPTELLDGHQLGGM